MRSVPQLSGLNIGAAWDGDSPGRVPQRLSSVHTGTGRLGRVSSEGLFKWQDRPYQHPTRSAVSWLHERDMRSTEDVVREGWPVGIVTLVIVMGILLSWSAVVHLYGNTRFPRLPLASVLHAHSLTLVC